MIEFRVTEHTMRANEHVVECWKGDLLVGVIYSDPKKTGILVLSKYLNTEKVFGQRREGVPSLAVGFDVPDN